MYAVCCTVLSCCVKGIDARAGKSRGVLEKKKKKSMHPNEGIDLVHEGGARNGPPIGGRRNVQRKGNEQSKTGDTKEDAS